MTDNDQYTHVKNWLKDGKQVQVNVFGKWRTVSPSIVQKQIDKGRHQSQFRLAFCYSCHCCRSCNARDYCNGERTGIE